MQNEFDKQHGLTLRGIINGAPGERPIPYGIIPLTSEASQSLSVSEYNSVYNSIVATYERNNASDSSGGGGGTGGLPMNIYYISGNNGSTITANAVNNSTAPASVTILGNGSFGSEQDTYGGEDLYFTFTIPSPLIKNGGEIRVGIESRTNPTGYNLYTIISTGPFANRLVVFTNGDTTFTAVGGHTYHMRYVQSTTPATLSLYDATAGVVVVPPRDVPIKLTDYYIFLTGANTGVGSSPYTPITVTGIDIQPYTP